MVFLKKIILNNFISHKYTEFDINEGHYLIVGENKDSDYSQSNGAGKSALFEALIYALYGNATRNYQRKNTDDTYVELILYQDDIEVKIRRYYNHKEYKNKVFLYLNEEDNTQHTIKETQKKIDNIIRYSYEHFISSVVLKQGFEYKLTSLTPSKRKEYFSSIIDFDFDGTLKKIKSDKEILIEKKYELQSEISKLQSNLSYLQGKIESIVSFQKVNDNEIEKLYSQLKQLENKVKELTDEKSKYSTDKLDLLIQRLDKQIAVKQNHFKQYQKLLKTNTCPLCKSTIDKSKIETDFNTLKQEINLYKERFSKLQQVSDKVKSIDRKIQELMLEKNSIQSLLTKLLAKKNQNEDLEKITKQSEELKQKIEELSSEMTFIEDDINRLSTLEDLFKLSGELRSVVLKSYLDLFNDILSFYTVSLYPEISIRFELDDKLKGIEIKGIDYQSMSGGEKRRIDIIIQLAFSDFITKINRNSFNLLVLDEVFDNIDSKATSNILSFLTENLPDKSIYVISHNEGIKQYFNNIIKIQKEQGISYLTNQ